MARVVVTRQPRPPSRVRVLYCRTQRQPDREAGALSDGTLDRNRAAVQLREGFHDCQAQSRALEFSRQATVDLTEGLEQLLQPVWRDAEAVVADPDPYEFLESAIGER